MTKWTSQLTAFLPADPAKMDAGYQGRSIFRHLDDATVQGYDVHGTWESTTNHQSAIFQPAMRLKTAYIKRKGLGGAMVWSLDGDDANGSPIDAIHRGLPDRR